MKTDPDATLLPVSGDTDQIQDQIDATFAEMWTGAVLEIRCHDIDLMCDLAGRSLLAGRRIVDPFEPWTPSESRLLIENWVREPACAAAKAGTVSSSNLAGGHARIA